MAWLPGQRITAQRLRDNSPRLVTYASLTASTAATSSTTLQAAITTDPVSFRAGRAFRIAFRGGLGTDVMDQQGSVVIAKGTAAGPVLLNAQRIHTAQGQVGTVAFYFENIIVNASGADITTALVGAYQMVYRVGTGNVWVFGSSATPSYIEVIDVGLAADYPGATALT